MDVEQMEQTTLMEEPDGLAGKRGKVRGLFAAKLLAGVAIVVAVVVNVRVFPSKAGSTLAELQRFKPSALTVLDLEDEEEDPCKDEAQLRTTKITHNNLCGKGPGTGDEGMVFEGTYLSSSGESQNVELHINCDSDDFQPAWTNKLGFFGESNNFMSINTKAASEVTVKFKVTKPGKTDALELETLDLTFFDLDKHEHGNEEYVKVKDFQTSLTYEGTELEMITPDHFTTFLATKKGTGADNPTNPLKLTEEQLQRAFTVEFKPFTGATVTLGNKEHAEGKTTHGRRFDFIGKPSLKCALGVDPNKVTARTQLIPQCCVIKISSFGLMCVDAADAQFYHFMCDPVPEEP